MELGLLKAAQSIKFTWYISPVPYFSPNPIHSSPYGCLFKAGIGLGATIRRFAGAGPSERVMYAKLE